MADAPAAARAGLAAIGVSHAYGARRALIEVGLTVAPGELVCLVGPSGCGKTTLLRVVAGLEDLQSGRIVIDGATAAEPGRALPPEARGVGFVFQDMALFPHMSVADNVAFGLDSLAGEARRRRIDEALEQVGMSDYRAAYPHRLSGGQQQRVALARALAPRPRVLLLDEPFSGLDTRLREALRDDTLHVLKGSGSAALMVTHDPEEAMFMADRIAVMREGRIEQEGRPDEVYMRPASAFVAAFFGQVNEVAGAASGGFVATPFGRVAAPGFADGTRVRVLIRPEMLRLAPVPAVGPDPHCPAKVLASRLLGRTSWIHLCLGPSAVHGGAHERDPGHLHFHARAPGRYLPPEGEVLDIVLDPSQVFVFPAEASHIG